MVSHSPAKFGGHRHCGSEDMMFLICHAILQDHVSQKEYIFLARSPWKYVNILSSLVAIDTAVVEI